MPPRLSIYTHAFARLRFAAPFRRQKMRFAFSAAFAPFAAPFAPPFLRRA